MRKARKRTSAGFRLLPLPSERHEKAKFSRTAVLNMGTTSLKIPHLNSKRQPNVSRGIHHMFGKVRTSSSSIFSVQISASSNMLEAKASRVMRPLHLCVSLTQSTSAEFRASASVVSGICRQTDVTEKLQQIKPGTYGNE